jgi:hypothetical protein
MTFPPPMRPEKPAIHAVYRVPCSENPESPHVPRGHTTGRNQPEQSRFSRKSYRGGARKVAYVNMHPWGTSLHT